MSQQTYRIFVEDVGRNKFSAVADEIAESPRRAIMRHYDISPNSNIGMSDRSIHWMGKKLIALPHSRMDLWPNGKTGVVPKEALKFK